MCNFIMIMILLVTAYNGIAKKGIQERVTHGYTQGYSKYLRCPRVRTARPTFMLDLFAMSCCWTHHLAAVPDGAAQKASASPASNNRIV